MDSVQELEIQEAEDYDYSDLDADSCNGANNVEDEIIDYHQILKEMSKLAEAREFLDTYQTCVGPNVIDNYETLPAYKYYYRFFMPIEYHHPDIKGCDESVWPMLFQLLWGNMDAACRIVKCSSLICTVHLTGIFTRMSITAAWKGTRNR